MNQAISSLSLQSMIMQRKPFFYILLSLNLICQSTYILAQTAHCGSQERENFLLESHIDSDMNRVIESQTEAYIHQLPAIKKRGNYQINLVVHVIYHTAEENISDAQIKSQIEVLNQDFQAKNLDYTYESYFAFNKGNAQISFALAEIDPDGNPGSGITRSFTELENIGEKKDINGRSFIKHSDLGGVDAWPTENYINIWLGDRTASFGEGSRPGLSLEGEDGIVIDPAYFGTLGTAENSAPYNLGRICTHEMGHYLNLIHPWGTEQTCLSDDQVEDTPLQEQPFYDCIEPNYACGEREMVHNFMDYVEDGCMYYFTKGQVNRMWACLEGPRKSLWTLEDDLPSQIFPDQKPFWARMIPGLDELHIYMQEGFELTGLDVYTAEGKKIATHKGNSVDFIKINTGQWETGPYIVCLQSGQQRWTEKLIKLKL